MHKHIETKKKAPKDTVIQINKKNKIPWEPRQNKDIYYTICTNSNGTLQFITHSFSP